MSAAPAELRSSLLALQQADSFFPGGAVAWSWGLETLVADSGETFFDSPVIAGYLADLAEARRSEARRDAAGAG